MAVPVEDPTVPESDLRASEIRTTGIASLKHEGAEEAERLWDESTHAEADPTLARGRGATDPSQLGRDGWLDVLFRVVDEAEADQIALVAGGVAFSATLSLFPTVIALISIYGLAFSSGDIVSQLQLLTAALPQDAARLLEREAIAFASRPTQLGLGAAVGISVALFSASGGAKRLLDAINIAYDERQRGFLRQRFLALLLAAAGVLLTMISLSLIGLTPQLIGFIGIGTERHGLLLMVRWVSLAALFFLGLCALYRIAPDRRAARPRWIVWGAGGATLLWLLASWVLSFYFENIHRLGVASGPLGGIFALMVWLFVTTYVVILGAELNAELEAQTVKDSTVGPLRPLGQRKAVKADHLGTARPKNAEISLLDFLRQSWSTRRSRQQRAARQQGGSKGGA